MFVQNETSHSAQNMFGCPTLNPKRCGIYIAAWTFKVIVLRLQ